MVPLIGWNVKLEEMSTVKVFQFINSDGWGLGRRGAQPGADAMSYGLEYVCFQETPGEVSSCHWNWFQDFDHMLETTPVSCGTFTTSGFPAAEYTCTVT